MTERQRGDVLLVDSHVHLDRYADDQARALVARAVEAGVHRLLTIGVDLPSSRAALRLARELPGVLAAVGIHPLRLEAATGSPAPERGSGRRAARDAGGGERAEAWAAALRPLLEEGPAAIGEVGLDASGPDLDGQQRFLAACFALAEAHSLPVVLHVVGAPAVHEAALTIARRHPTVRAVAHYFVGGPELARRYLDAGCWISVGRPVTRPQEATVREAVRLVPLDRLLLETDTYPLPGRTTEPRDVTTVCAAVAALMGRSYAEVAAATSASFAAFIGARQ